jgi:hypothetical protein
VGGDGAVVDDAAASRVLALHHAEGFSDAEEHPGQVDVHDLPPLLVRDVLERNRRCPSPGVVEQDVEASEGSHGGREERLHGFGVADVRGNRERPGPRA